MVSGFVQRHDCCNEEVLGLFHLHNGQHPGLEDVVVVYNNVSTAIACGLLFLKGKARNAAARNYFNPSLLIFRVYLHSFEGPMSGLDNNSQAQNDMAGADSPIIRSYGHLVPLHLCAWIRQRPSPSL